MLDLVKIVQLFQLIVHQLLLILILILLLINYMLLFKVIL
jgi:hypothetical protein